MSWDSDIAALTGLVGWWKFDETSGTTADNAEGNAAKDGTYTGDYTLAQSPLLANTPAGYSVKFNNGAGYVVIPDHDDWSLTTTGALSIGVWHVPVASNGNSVVVGKGTASNYEWAIYWGTESYYCILWQAAGGGRITVTNAQVCAIGEPHFIVLTLDDSGGDSAYSYLDDVQSSQFTTFTGSSTNGTSPVNVGRRPDNQAYNNGTVDELFIVNRVLSSAEVSALYASGLAEANAQKLRPDADVTTTGWSTAPLWSKIEEESADGTVISATAS